MTDLAAALQELHPDVETIRIGRHDVRRFRTITPAHTFESVIKDVDGGRLVELTARDSFDVRLAEFLLDEVALLDLPEPTSKLIRVFPATSPKPWAFSTLVVAPPLVAHRFEHQSVLLQRCTYWVVPAFEGEFEDRNDGAAFWHQIGRKDGWKSSVINWNRLQKTKPVFD